MKNYKRQLTVLTAILLFGMASCQNKPDYLIDDDTFAAVLAEMMLIEKLPVSKEERIRRTQAVFEKYKVSPESFAKTKLYHKRDVDFWQRIYHKTMKQLEKKAEEQREKNRPKQTFSSREKEPPGPKIGLIFRQLFTYRAFNNKGRRAEADKI